MKKVLFASDGTQFSEGAFQFTRRLNELSPILLTGVFMPQISFADLWRYASNLEGPGVPLLNEMEDTESIQKNILHFEQLCRDHNIKYSIHEDSKDFALTELHNETRFADLLILSSEKFYHRIWGGKALDYIEEALKEAECPILIVPEKFDFPTKNIIAYDGSASSVYAIKQFAYLFPELCELETTILYVSKKEEDDLPQQVNLEDLVQQHFKRVNFLKLNMDPEKHFSSWISEKKQTLLIGGAFGHSSVFKPFKKSFFHSVIAEHQLPIFIAHR